MSNKITISGETGLLRIYDPPKNGIAAECCRVGVLDAHITVSDETSLGPLAVGRLCELIGAEVPEQYRYLNGSSIGQGRDSKANESPVTDHGTRSALERLFTGLKF